MRPALLLLMLTAALAAQPASIDGVVVNHATGQPLSGVHVRLMTGDFGNGGIDQATGAISAYKFAAVPPAKYKLLVVDGDALSVILRGRAMEDDEDIAESLDLHAGDKIVKDLKQRMWGSQSWLQPPFRRLLSSEVREAINTN
jgi:hypothetical protein